MDIPINIKCKEQFVEIYYRNLLLHFMEIVPLGIATTCLKTKNLIQFSAFPITN